MSVKHQNLVKQILLFLTQCGHTAWQVPTGAAVSMDGKRIIKYGLDGHSDIIDISNNLTLFIEVKIPPDKQREGQKNFERMVNKYRGHRYIIVSPESFDIFKERVLHNLFLEEP
jgi:hypothetical protein